MNNELVITCPHCNQLVIIAEMNCRKFRHAIYKSNGEQINPHSSKAICDELTSNDLIYGCGKPFYIDSNNKLIVCDYI